MRNLVIGLLLIISKSASASNIIPQQLGNITVLIEPQITPLAVEDNFRTDANSDSVLALFDNDSISSISDVQFVQSDNSSVSWDSTTSSVTYSPQNDFRGLDRFQYLIIDENGVKSELTDVNVEVVIGKAQKPIISPLNGIDKHLVWLDGNTQSVMVSVSSSPGASITMEFANRDTGEVTSNIRYTGPFKLYSNTRVVAWANGLGYEESDYTFVSFLFCEENTTEPNCGYVAPEASEVGFGWAANTIKVGQTAVFNWNISNVTSCIEELSSEQGHNVRPGNGSIEYRFDTAGEIQAKWHCLDINNDHIYPADADFRTSTLTVEKLDRVSNVSSIRGYQTNSAIVDWQAVPFAHSYQIQSKKSAASYWSVLPVCSSSVGAKMCFESMGETSVEVKNISSGGQLFRIVACIEGSCENTSITSANAFLNLPLGGMKSTDDVIEIENAPGETVLNVSQNDTSPYSGNFNPVIYKQPQAGTLRVQGSELLYTPLAGYAGSVQFEYYQKDGVGNTSNIAKATINIVTPNDPPVISSITNRSLAEDGQANVAFTVTDTETQPSSLTFSATSSNSELLSNASLSITGSGSHRQVTLNPVNNKHGSSNVTISVSDGVNVVSESFTVTVTPVNDLPVGEVTISGGAVVGETIVASSAVTDSDGIGNDFDWQWFRDGQLISGANTASLVLGSADLGSRIVAVMNYVDNDGTAESVSSAPTAIVASAVPETEIHNLGVSATSILIGERISVTFNYVSASKCYNGDDDTEVFYEGELSSGLFTGELDNRYVIGEQTLNVVCENALHSASASSNYQIRKLDAPVNLGSQ